MSYDDKLPSKSGVSCHFFAACTSPTWGKSAVCFLAVTRCHIASPPRVTALFIFIAVSCRLDGVPTPSGIAILLFLCLPGGARGWHRSGRMAGTRLHRQAPDSVPREVCLSCREINEFGFHLVEECRLQAFAVLEGIFARCFLRGVEGLDASTVRMRTPALCESGSRVPPQCCFVVFGFHRRWDILQKYP